MFSPSKTSFIPYLFSHVQEIIDHRVRGKTKKEVRELFQGYIDLENYARMIRTEKKVSGPCGVH